MNLLTKKIRLKKGELSRYYVIEEKRDNLLMRFNKSKVCIWIFYWIYEKWACSSSFFFNKYYTIDISLNWNKILKLEKNFHIEMEEIELKWEDNNIKFNWVPNSLKKNTTHQFIVRLIVE